MTNKTRNEVFEALDQAKENGYDMTDWAPQDVALDLCEYNSDFEDTDPQSLIVDIEAWQKK